MNQFICLLSDPNSPAVLQEVDQEMGSDVANTSLDKAVSNKVKGKSGIDGKKVELFVGDSAGLLKELLATQDRLLRAQIRLQVYQKLQVNYPYLRV